MAPGGEAPGAANFGLRRDCGLLRVVEEKREDQDALVGSSEFKLFAASILLEDHCGRYSLGAFLSLPRLRERLHKWYQTLYS